MDSQTFKFIVVILAPLVLIIAATMASIRVRRWTAAQEREVSTSEPIQTIGALSSAVMLFVGVSLMTFDGTEFQGFIVTFLGGPLLFYLGFFYPRALHANIDNLRARIDLLEKEIAKG